jgi:hypothetical protein
VPRVFLNLRYLWTLNQFPRIIHAWAVSLQAWNCQSRSYSADEKWVSRSQTDSSLEEDRRALTRGRKTGRAEALQGWLMDHCDWTDANPVLKAASRKARGTWLLCCCVEASCCRRVVLTPNNGMALAISDNCMADERARLTKPV